MDKQEFEQKKQEFSPIEYMQMPVTAYMFEMEARERKERRLYNTILALIIAIVVIVAGFLWHMNQFFVVGEDYIQEISGNNNQDMSIEDGIHLNDTPMNE